MCGIAGFLGLYEESLLPRLADSMSHRGPDDAGWWHDPAAGIGLAHRRLSIIDLTPRAHQPMWDVEGKVVVVYNGEIYNYRELRVELEKAGYQFKSDSDTEVILNLYRYLGRPFLQRLNGIYAFAIWDSEKRALLLARDGLGVKPLYWSRSPRGLVFASEIKSLLLCPDLDKSLDYEAVLYYLTYLYAPSPHTLFNRVRKLRPGYAIWANREGLFEEWSYYDIPFRASLPAMSLAEARDGLSSHLANAVRRQMVADVPVGAFLSGGLDSSAIACLARQHVRDGQLPCFTLGVEGQEAEGHEGMVSDLPYARQVARHLGIPLEVVPVNARQSGAIEETVWQLDEPQADTAALSTLLICQAARRQGIKVLLSGTGGDDLLTGYRRHAALRLEKWWNWLPRSARRALKLASSLPSTATPIGRRLAKAFRYAEAGPEERLAGYFLWLDGREAAALYGPLLRQHLAGVSSEAPLLDELKRLPSGVHPINRMLYLDMKFFLADHNLNYTDKMSMACGVEVRVPFLDNDLVDFATRLPVHFKQRGAVGKWIFRKAMEDYLPHDVIYRSKTGFGMPLRAWLKDGFAQLIREYLDPAVIRRRGLFDADAVHQLIRRDQAGQIDAAYNILALVCLEVWLRRFHD